MAFLERNTLWRKQTFCANSTLFRSFFIRWLKMVPRASHPHIRDASDRNLRDIGLSPTDVAPYRHKLPSQHTHHPRG